MYPRSDKRSAQRCHACGQEGGRRGLEGFVLVGIGEAHPVEVIEWTEGISITHNHVIKLPSPVFPNGFRGPSGRCNMLMEAAYYIFGAGREDGRGLLGEAVRSCGSRHWSLMRQGLGDKAF